MCANRTGGGQLLVALKVGAYRRPAVGISEIAQRHDNPFAVPASPARPEAGGLKAFPPTAEQRSDGDVARPARILARPLACRVRGRGPVAGCRYASLLNYPSTDRLEHIFAAPVRPDGATCGATTASGGRD